MRTERDSLGPIDVPADAYWGAHTARALENFTVSGIPVGRHRGLVAALGAVKMATTRANARIGLLTAAHHDVVFQAAGELRSGRFDDQLVVDVVQGGAGTSTNMNVNEVLANRALELLGQPRGAYDVLHPIDHVNRSQSTNDVYPTAVRIAFVLATDELSSAVTALADAFARKATQYRTVAKMGRTQLQDAVPMTVGQELGAFAITLREEVARLRDVRSLMCEVNLGATAIGTGITADPGYAQRVVPDLAAVTGLPLVRAHDLVAATSDTGAFVQGSSVLKRLAVKLSKIANDLRLLSSGPQAGLGELLLPPRQAGSSIMPGKVNPVIPEMVNQVAFWVVGTDMTVTMAAEGGQLQLNAFEPIICHGLLQGAAWLTNAMDSLRLLCVDDLAVDLQGVAVKVARNAGLATALTPTLGYNRSAEIAEGALAGKGTVQELAVATGLLTADAAHVLLHPETLANLATVASHDGQPVAADPWVQGA
ncbi:aspartate ammonia-lyase [Nocardioides alkalitolerans]|uniref:aspartate ammonia-lyase n=1 Tax=Nocardioides alkalitolerans TaxID=281714 RepID=UPI00041DDA5C|nr:aspartate ammonia-lyase [Nocardioides alkalitolerans]